MELNGRKITALPARHAVPSVAYQLDSGAASLVYSGDTTWCEELWLSLDRIANLKYLLIENTFLNANAANAARSGHMTASLLARGMRLLHRPVELFIVHIEAGSEDETFREIQRALPELKPALMQRGQALNI